MRILYYPITIIKTRYSGVYEGGPWAAFNLDPAAIPLAATGSDPECMCWWDDYGRGIGIGNSPDGALEALKAIEEPFGMIWDVEKRVHYPGFRPWTRAR